MKQTRKYISILSAILLAMSFVMAQAQKNRTSLTIVADVLAQLPAKTQPQYNQLMDDLTSTGEEGLLNLISRLNPPGNKSNEAVDYAISGWTNYVANDPAKRSIATNAYEKALNQSLDSEIKAMLIRQLEKIGDNSNIDVLSNFLTNEQLAGPASQALLQLNSAGANQAILSALSQTNSGSIKTILVNALAQTDYAPTESTLLNILKNNSADNLQKVIYNTLGKLGTKASLHLLKSAAEESSYTYQKNNATAAYLSLLSNLIAIDAKLVKKEAGNLLKSATKLNQTDLKIAATKLLLSIPLTNKKKILKETLKDGDISFLTSILNAYPFQNNKKTLKLITKALSPKAPPEKQTAILYWLGNQKVDMAIPYISNYSSSPNEIVQKAAITALGTINKRESMELLVGILSRDDETSVAFAKQALESYNGDMSSPLASVFNDAGKAGKIAALQLMAKCRMESQYDLVYKQMFQNDETVKSEAAKTLQYVTTDKNLSDLFTLLEQLETKYIPAIQQAINAGLSNLSPSEQMKLISGRMNNSNKKYLYYSALANTQSKDAKEMLLNTFNSQSVENKQAAFNALLRWKSFDGIYPLLNIARNSSNEKFVEQSIEAILQKITSSHETGAVKYLFLREAMELTKTNKQKKQILRLLGNTNMYQALLFVAPYMEQAALKEQAAQSTMNLAINNSLFSGNKTTEILRKVSQTLNNPDADYQRQSINKYLNENSKNEGYIAIFNGKNLDGWKGLVENPIKRNQMSMTELENAQEKANQEAQTSWIVENGDLVFTGKGHNLCTKKQYGDFDMLIDWKLFPGPEPDAGIYLRGTPQVQIWDTARVNVGAQVGSGGLYNNKINESKPLKVADIGVGEWNTFRIRMIGDRVSIWLNGELVTDNVILENYWDRDQPIFPMEQIELQAHVGKVAYRDIYIKEIKRPEPFKLSKSEKKEGFKILFDGTNMYAWTGNTKDYVLEDGNIVLHPSQNFGGNLYTKEQFDNFIFRFEFMLTPGANNGLGIRAPLEGDAAYNGMELQILDNEAPVYKDLHDYQYHGSVYGVIPAKRGYLNPVGEWNYQEVVADGDHIKITLNGAVILDGNIREASKNGTMDGKKHPGLLNKTGHIGFLGHGSEVKFKNIRIKEL